MRKAFDANVPKLKPRLKLGVPAGVDEVDAPVEPPTAIATAIPSVRPERSVAAGDAKSKGAIATARGTAKVVEDKVEVEDQVQVQVQDQVQVQVQDQVQVQVQVLDQVEVRQYSPTTDVLSRRDRLEKIKRRVAEAARPQPRVQPVPADPARAAESVLGLVRDLEVELVRAREREEALRADLDDARRELGRAATEGRTAVEKLATTEKELEEKRSVLGELLAEMQALEEERDEPVRRAQGLAALDEERARLLDELGRRADEEAKLRAEREAEVERLSEELRISGAEGARLRAAVGELARERDQLGADLDRTRGERDDLAEAKKALEAVHAALSQARARLA